MALGLWLTPQPQDIEIVVREELIFRWWLSLKDGLGRSFPAQ